MYGPQDFLRALRKLLPDRAVELAEGAGKGKARPRVDLSAAKAVLGYEPQYSLEKGLEHYMEVSRKHGFWS